jgi:cytidylate kinase
MTFTIAIDGPAAAGKGTLSRKIADAYGFHHLDTGPDLSRVGQIA